MSKSALDLISDAYLFALQVTEEPLRSRNQSIYAGLRDYIANRTGKDSQDVQDRYEEVAKLLRESNEWKRNRVLQNTSN